MRALVTGLLTFCLAFPGPISLIPKAQATQRPDSRESLLQARLRTLHLAVDFANEAPDAAEGRLQQAIEALYPFAPEIAHSPQARRDQRRAELTLARALMINQRLALAELSLRNLYSIDPPSEREVSAFGPSLAEHAKQARIRVEELPKGIVEIECARACAAYLNERRISLVSNVPNGEYRLYVKDLAGQAPVLQKRIELRGDKALVRVRFDNAPLPQEEPSPTTPRSEPNDPTPSPKRPTAQPEPSQRVAPLWLEVSGLALGAGMMVTGGLLVPVQTKRCAVTDADGNCLKDRNYKTPGIALLIAGGALLVTSSVLLIVDRKRGRRRREKLSGLLRGEVKF